MTFCNHCGKENKDGAKFCVACGNKLAAATPSPDQQGQNPAQENQEAPATCPQCGKSNKPNAKFCVQCGYNLASAAKQEQAPVVVTQEVPDNAPVCTNCGRLNKPSDKFCLSCGNKLGPSTQQPKEAEPPVVVQEPLVEKVVEIQQEPTPIAETIAIKEELPVAESIITQRNTGVDVEIPKHDTTPVEEESPVVEDIPATVSMHDDLPVEEETAPIEEPVEEKAPEEPKIPAVVASLYERIAMEKKLREAAAKSEKYAAKIETPAAKIETPAAESYTAPKTYEPDYGTPYVSESVAEEKSESVAEEKISRIKEDYSGDVYMAKPLRVMDDDDELAPIPIIKNNNSRERRRKMILFMTLGILALAVLGIGGYFLLNSDNDKSTSEKKDALKPNTPTRGIDSVTPGGGTLSNNSDPATNTKLDPPPTNKVDSTSLVTKPDKFKYLTIGQITSDLRGKKLCEGVAFTGQGQTLRISESIPDQQFQKNFAENGVVTIVVSFRDNIENKSCTIEVLYKKQGNKFSFDDYAQR